MIHTSPALLVDKETPILDCVRHMNSQNVGSLLIVDYLNDNRLVGIFTERDLLKHFVYLQEHPGDNRPVRTVMTRDVTTLPIARLEEAPQFMLKGGFRHLPIVAGASGKSAQQLLGVVSMRDFFKLWAENGATPPTGLPLEKKRRPSSLKTLEIHTHDATAKVLLRKLANLLQKQGDEVQLLDRTGMPPLFSEDRILFLDLDDFEKSEWLEMLKQINHLDPAPLTLLAYTPSRFTPETQAILQKLSVTETFESFPKPMDVLALLQELLSRK